MTIRLSFSLFVIRFSSASRLIGRTEQLDLLFYLVHDGCSAGSQELSRVEALALLILACLDVLSGCLCEYELALGVHVDLSNIVRRGCWIRNLMSGRLKDRWMICSERFERLPRRRERFSLRH